MRKGLAVEELGDLLDRPFNATLATYRRDGSVLLSPVWHEWRDGGFSIFTGATDVKIRHVVHDPDVVRATLDRIVGRYLSPRQAGVYIAGFNDQCVEPGRLRTWDFADDATLA